MGAVNPQMSQNFLLKFRTGTCYSPQNFRQGVVQVLTSFWCLYLEHISHLVLVFLLLNLNMKLSTGKCWPIHKLHETLVKIKEIRFEASKMVAIGSMVFTAQKIKFSIKDFFSKCDQIRRFLWIWSPLLKKFLMENFIFM